MNALPLAALPDSPAWYEWIFFALCWFAGVVLLGAARGFFR